MLYTFQFLFSRQCHAVAQLDKLITAMSEARVLTLEKTVLQSWIPQVLWEVTTALDTFFTDASQGRKATMDIQNLIAQIKARKVIPGDDLTLPYRGKSNSTNRTKTTQVTEDKVNER